MPSAKRGGPRNITMQDIADRCGVTKVTVSRALRGESPRVSQETAARIREVASELGYDASSQHVARRLAMRKRGVAVRNHMVGCFIPAGMVDHPYYNRILAGIMDAAAEDQYGVLLNYSNNAAAQSSILPIFSQGDADAALVMASPRLFNPVLERLRQISGFQNRPIAFMVHDHPDCPGVGGQDREGAAAVTRRLLELGHRKILHFYFVQYDTDGLRRQGIHDALTEAGLDPATAAVEQQYSHGHEDRSRQWMREALAAHPDVTAIIAPNDTGALMFADELAKMGKRLPTDMSLVGWDDTHELRDDRGRNILSSVEVPLRQIGHDAMKLVVNRVDSGDRSPGMTRLPVRLIERGSIGPAPTA